MPDLVLHNISELPPAEAALVKAAGHRSIVLIGMMGAGKSSVGRKLALRLGIPFVDADTEIERAAGMSIPDIFEIHGETEFRAGESRVIARLLDGGPQVLATGGGAFMNAATRARIREKGISVWLKADFEVLLRRITRRSDRPLLDVAACASWASCKIRLSCPVVSRARRSSCTLSASGITWSTRCPDLTEMNRIGT